jgi:hypothetical protein
MDFEVECMQFSSYFLANILPNVDEFGEPTLLLSYKGLHHKTGCNPATINEGKIIKNEMKIFTWPRDLNLSIGCTICVYNKILLVINWG